MNSSRFETRLGNNCPCMSRLASVKARELLTETPWEQQRAGHFEPIVYTRMQCFPMHSGNWPTTGKPEAMQNRFFRSRRLVEERSATAETLTATARTGAQKNATTSLESRRARFVLDHCTQLDKATLARLMQGLKLVQGVSMTRDNSVKPS